MRNWNVLKSRVSEICVKRISINPGVGVVLKKITSLCWPKGVKELGFVSSIPCHSDLSYVYHVALDRTIR